MSLLRCGYKNTMASVLDAFSWVTHFGGTQLSWEVALWEHPRA